MAVQRGRVLVAASRWVRAAVASKRCCPAHASRSLKHAATYSGGNPVVMRRLAQLQEDTTKWDDFDDFHDSDSDVSRPKQAGHRTALASVSEGTRRVEDVPLPTDWSVRSAAYVSSAVALDSCPAPEKAEIAVIGRSNVGKSSLINMLTRDRELALVSKQPGKTKCINHFIINDAWYLVDLPGYGYARRSRKERLAWNEFTKDYFLRRETLVTVLLLVDGSIPPQAVDLECASWLAGANVPYNVVFTKADKRKKKTSPVHENVSQFIEMLRADFDVLPNLFVTSAAEGAGGVDLLKHMARLRVLWAQDS